MTPAKLLTPTERAAMLRSLKRGPALGRKKLVAYAAALYQTKTGRELEKGAA